MTGQGETDTSSARVVVTRVFGVLVAASAAEHGLGEALQGSRAAAGPFIQSWPDAALFRIEAGEPALTLLPNLVAAGVLTLLPQTRSASGPRLSVDPRRRRDVVADPGPGAAAARPRLRHRGRSAGSSHPRCLRLVPAVRARLPRRGCRPLEA